MAERSRLIFDVMCVLGSSFGLLTGLVSIGGDILYTIGALALVAIAGFFVVISVGDLVVCMSASLGPRLQHLRKSLFRFVKRTAANTAEPVTSSAFFVNVH